MGASRKPVTASSSLSKCWQQLNKFLRRESKRQDTKWMACPSAEEEEAVYSRWEEYKYTHTHTLCYRSIKMWNVIYFEKTQSFPSVVRIHNNILCLCNSFHLKRSRMHFRQLYIQRPWASPSLEQVGARQKMRVCGRHHRERWRERASWSRAARQPPHP